MKDVKSAMEGKGKRGEWGDGGGGSGVGGGVETDTFMLRLLFSVNLLKMCLCRHEVE